MVTQSDCSLTPAGRWGHAQRMSPTDNERGDIPFVKQDPGGPQCLITRGLIN